MASFAPVAPPQLLGDLDRRKILGNYHLLLAKEVLEDPKPFEKLFRDQPRRTVMMDNNVAETKGQPVDVKMVIEATKISGANVVILPDVYLDTDATIESCAEAIETWPQQIMDAGCRACSFMIVPQGKTLDDWIRCAEFFAYDQRIEWWGIPRNLTDIPEIGTREKAVYIAQALNSYRQIHLLGFSENIVDDILCANIPVVSGIDSAVPLRAAYYGDRFSLLTKLPPRGDWWKVAEPNDLVAYNLSLARNMVQK